MKVESGRSVGTPAVRKESKGAGGSGFANELRADDAAPAAAVRGPSALSGIMGLLALQETPDATDGTRRAIARGDEILDRLDDLRRGLLLGRVGRDKLAQLSHLASQGASEVTDPGLVDLLREIDLRAQVELAKLESSDA